MPKRVEPPIDIGLYIGQRIRQVSIYEPSPDLPGSVAVDGLYHAVITFTEVQTDLLRRLEAKPTEPVRFHWWDPYHKLPKPLVLRLANLEEGGKTFDFGILNPGDL